MKIRVIPVLAGFLSLFYACDKIDAPYGVHQEVIIEDLNTVKDSTEEETNPVNRILIEDLTGQFCGNCPEAAEILHELKEEHGDKIVGIGMHVGFFAEPFATGHFTIDYRTDAGNEVDGFYGASVAPGLPCGLINRMSFGGTVPQARTNWSTIASQLLPQSPAAKMNIRYIYNKISRQIEVKAEAELLSNLAEPMSIFTYIVEDSIVSPQKIYFDDNFPDEINLNYVHRHLMRKSLNGGWGAPVSSSASLSGDVLRTTDTGVLDPSWVASRCYIVCALVKTATHEVLQVREIKLKQGL